MLLPGELVVHRDTEQFVRPLGGDGTNTHREVGSLGDSWRWVGGGGRGFHRMVEGRMLRLMGM